MNRVLLAALLGMTLSAPVAADNYYKWQDENGTWHYTLEAPKHRESASVYVSGNAPVSGESLTPEPTIVVEDPTAPYDGEAPAGPPTKLAPKAEEMLAARKVNCDNAKTNQTTLRSYSQVSLDKDGDGNPETLTPEEHQVELEKAQSQVELYCD